MTWFQRLLLITIVATFALVVIGGVVRATDSGLGCPDWPACHGELIPKAEKHTLIEFSHRTAAAAVGVLFLGVTYFAFRTERRQRLVFWLSFTAGMLLVAQIILGGVTVKTELPPEIVAAHLATAMAFIGVMIVTAVISLMRARATPADSGATASAFTRLALATAAATFVTLTLGAYIADTSAALACDGWPLCNGSLLPGGGSNVGLHFLHRLLAGMLGLLILALIYQAFEERRGRPLLVALSLFAGVAYVAQALIGAANIWTELAAGVVVTHLSLAALLWCTTVALSVLSYYVPAGEREAAHGKRAEGRVTQWAR